MMPVVVNDRVFNNHSEALYSMGTVLKDIKRRILNMDAPDEDVDPVASHLECLVQLTSYLGEQFDHLQGWSNRHADALRNME